MPASLKGFLGIALACSITAGDLAVAQEVQNGGPEPSYASRILRPAIEAELHGELTRCAVASLSSGGWSPATYESCRNDVMKAAGLTETAFFYSIADAFAELCKVTVPRSWNGDDSIFSLGDSTYTFWFSDTTLSHKVEYRDKDGDVVMQSSAVLCDGTEPRCEILRETLAKQSRAFNEGAEARAAAEALAEQKNTSALDVTIYYPKPSSKCEMAE